MTLVRDEVRGAAVGVGISGTPEGFATLGKPGCAAVIWRRLPPREVQAWLDALPPDRLPSARVILAPSDMAAAVRRTCETVGLPPCAERAWLEADLAELAGCFAAVMGVMSLRMRLDVVTTNACRRFHIDAVTARLICTYRGPGTQYGISTDGSEPRRVFQVATGAPILLRGTLWPEEPRAGLLHRSPPIEGSGQTRLVLVLDPLDDPEDES